MEKIFKVLMNLCLPNIVYRVIKSCFLHILILTFPQVHRANSVVTLVNIPTVLFWPLDGGKGTIFVDHLCRQSKRVFNGLKRKLCLRSSLNLHSLAFQGLMLIAVMRVFKHAFTHCRVIHNHAKVTCTSKITEPLMGLDELTQEKVTDRLMQ